MNANNDVDVELFGMNLVMGRVFQQMLSNKLEEDDSEDSISQAYKSETDKTIASTMAQAVTGFGL